VRAFLNSEAGQIVIRRDVLSHQALERLGVIARGEAQALETEESVSVPEAARLNGRGLMGSHIKGERKGNGSHNPNGDRKHRTG